jgi:tetratricopeptide (TPR) repeat protein
MHASDSVRPWLALCALPVVLALAAPAQKKDPSPAPAPAVERNEKKELPAGGAREALKACREQSEKLKGLRGPSRDAALEEVAKSYEHVAGEFSKDRGTCAQAWFEAAELWRRGNDLAQAEAAYTKAVENDQDRYAERAWLELGNIQRRAKRPDDAIASYKKVIALVPKSSRAHDARLWVARTIQQKGSLAEAIEAYRAAFADAPSAMDKIEAGNWLAKALVTAGDLNAAADAIAAAEKCAEPLDGEDATRAQKEIESMSAKKALQRARDKATGAHKDAAAVEKAKR